MENMKRLLEFRKPRTGEKITFMTKQYFVASDGMVFNGDLNRYLKQRERGGYLSVVLNDDNCKKHTSIPVHNLVASCFIRLLERGENVHHKDHNRKNNNLSNLEIIDGGEHTRMHWRDGTMNGVAAKVSERMTKAWKEGTYKGIGDKMKKAWEDGAFDGNSAKMKKVWSSGRMDGLRDKLRQIGLEANPPKPVVQLGMDGRLVKIWPSIQECHRNGHDRSTVARCCRGERKTHKGFRWQWYEDFQKQKEERQELETLASK